MWKDCKYFILALIACVAMIATVLANELGGTYETVGEPYTASYSYCGAWAGAGGQHHCSMWLVGHERRINTIVHGWFFETTGYKVVAQ
jgi:hypothetical protein